MTTATKPKEIAPELVPHLERARRGERCSKIFDGVYTIHNHSSGQHRTFKISTVRNPESKLAGKRVVSLLRGPDNNSDYLGFAFLFEERIAVWKRWHGTAEPSPYDRYAALLWSLATEDEHSEKLVAAGAELLVEGRCMMCGRRLTVPESIRLGIGPVCLGG